MNESINFVEEGSKPYHVFLAVYNPVTDKSVYFDTLEGVTSYLDTFDKMVGNLDRSKLQLYQLNVYSLSNSLING